MKNFSLNSKYILLTVLAGAIIVAAFCLSSNYQLNKDIERRGLEARVGVLREVVYIINKGEGEISEYQIAISDKSTVFSLLEELSQKENFEITTTQYDFGIFVESIDGTFNGTENKYWQYWINEKLGEVAADKKDIRAGDKVEWMFEVPPEFF